MICGTAKLSRNAVKECAAGSMVTGRARLIPYKVSESSARELCEQDREVSARAALKCGSYVPIM